MANKIKQTKNDDYIEIMKSFIIHKNEENEILKIFLEKINKKAKSIKEKSK